MRKIPVVVSLALCFSLVSPSLYASADTIIADQITKEATTDTTEPTTIDQPSRMDNSQPRHRKRQHHPVKKPQLLTQLKRKIHLKII